MTEEGQWVCVLPIPTVIEEPVGRESAFAARLKIMNERIAPGGSQPGMTLQVSHRFEQRVRIAIRIIERMRQVKLPWIVERPCRQARMRQEEEGIKQPG